jgi:putative transposase
VRYRRSRQWGGTFFFTLVTYHRHKLLSHPGKVELLRNSFRSVTAAHPFTIDAIVVLPDHLHCIWRLPDGDADYPMRWRLVKSAFSRGYGKEGESTTTASRSNRGERAIWQRRYWEHTIRDEQDFVQHVEYIHYNPVKHGLVVAPRDWPHSSFMRYVRDGVYDIAWGAGLSMDFVSEVGFE